MEPQFFQATELLMAQARELCMDNNPDVQDLVLGAAFSGDLEMMQMVDEIFQMTKLERIAEPYPFYQPVISTMFNGDRPEDLIVLGRVKGTQNPIFINVLDLDKHCGIFGRPGAGKTTLLFWIISQTILRRKSVWIFDRDKQDYRHLKRLFPHLLVFSLLKDFKFNPLEPPPNVDPHIWKYVVMDVFTRTTDLLEASSAFMIKMLDKLYRKFGVFDGSKNYPTLIDLLQFCRAYKHENYDESRVKGRLINRLEGFLHFKPEIFDCSKGFSLEELATKPVVFELGGFPQSHAQFLINIILFWLFHFRISSQERNLGLRNLVVVDECKWLFPPRNLSSAITYKPVADLISKIREFGVGIVAADQTLNLDEGLLENTSLKISFNTDGKNLKIVKELFSLNNEQLDYVIYHLHKGEALVKCERVPHPFLLDIPKFPLE